MKLKHRPARTRKTITITIEHTLKTKITSLSNTLVPACALSCDKSDEALLSQCLCVNVKPDRTFRLKQKIVGSFGFSFAQIGSTISETSKKFSAVLSVSIKVRTFIVSFQVLYKMALLNKCVLIISTLLTD